MSTLTGQQIKDTFGALIKTADNLPIDATLKSLEDGLGNPLPMQVSQDTINFTGNVTGLPIKIDEATDQITTKYIVPNASNIINFSTFTNGIYSEITDAISMGFDSANYGNGIFIGKYGASTPGSTVVGLYSFSNGFADTIIGSGNGAGNGGNNIIIGKNIFTGNGLPEAIGIGNGITVDEPYTLHTKSIKGTDYKVAGYGPVIDAGGNWVGQPIGGGGTSATPAMTLQELPPLNINTFADTTSWVSWVQAATYTTTPVSNTNTQGRIAIFPLAEGQTITKVLYGIQTAATTGTAKAALYYLQIAPNGQLEIGNKALDLGSVDATTATSKEIDLTSAPFTMPSGQTYGAIALVLSSTNTTGFRSWNTNATWSGNGGGYNGSDFYRACGLNIESLTSGVLPASLSGSVITGSTSNPLWAFISTQNI